MVSGPPAVAFGDRPPDAMQTVARETLAGFRLRIPDSDAPTAVHRAIRSSEVLIARRRRIGARELEIAAPSLIVVLGRNPIAVSLRAARLRGVTVRTIPHPGALAVADHTLALLLSVARRIVEGDQGVRTGAYRQRGLVPRPTTERSYAFNWLGRKDTLLLDGLRLGLVGFGAIGQEVARRALGFGMRVRYFQRRPLSTAWNRRLGVASAASLVELLEGSDVVSLHAPHTAETEHLLDADALDRLPRGAVVINTARGGLIEEAALAERLGDGRLGGAGLDVFREEPLPIEDSKGHPFVNTPRLVLAPHAGGAGAGGLRALFAAVADAIRDSCAGAGSSVRR